MSCLFQSLEKYVGDDAYTIRQKICDYLLTNPKLIDDLDFDHIIEGGNTSSYISHMRSMSTFGGAIEIRAFTKLYKHNVLVKSLPNNREIEFIEDDDLSFIILTWNGGHFESG